MKCSYRGGRPPLELAGKTVIVVDDGIATGCSILAAIAAIRRRNAARVVVAVPVAPASGCDAIRMEADERHQRGGAENVVGSFTVV